MVNKNRSEELRLMIIAAGIEKLHTDRVGEILDACQIKHGSFYEALKRGYFSDQMATILNLKLGLKKEELTRSKK